MRRITIFSLLILMSLTALPTPAQNQIIPEIFVDDDNTTGIVNGSPSNPYTNVQHAIDSASNGSVIRVAAGTYPQNIRVRSKSIQLYGGYVGGTSADYANGVAGNFGTRDLANQSHLQGDSQDSTVTLLDAGESIVDGFRITGGSRTVEFLPSCCWGGGFYINGGAPTISNNLIEDNDTRTAAETTEEMVGGGVYSESADISILDNVIRNNISGRGAGIAAFGGTVVIRGNTVERNTGVGDHGGGLFIAASNLELSHNRIIGNEIGRELGYGWGGGITLFNAGSQALFSYNVFTENSAPTVGSAVFIDDGTTAALEHELIYANQCTSQGGVAIYVDGMGDGGLGSTVFIDHTTIADHDCVTSIGGNAVYVEQESLVAISNSILWGNGGDDIIADDTSAVIVSYTLSNEAIEGDGNFSADPLFADAARGDYHLRSTAGRWDPTAEGGVGGWVQDSESSPAIDVGDPGAAFDAEPEPNGGRTNLGVYGNTAEASQSEG